MLARKSLTNATPFSTNFPLSMIGMDGWETKAPQGGGFRINNDNLWYFARQQLADASISLLILSCKPVHAVVRVNTKLAGIKSVFCRTNDSGSFQKFHNRDTSVFETYLANITSLFTGRRRGRHDRGGQSRETISRNEFSLWKKNGKTEKINRLTFNRYFR